MAVARQPAAVPVPMYEPTPRRAQVATEIPNAPPTVTRSEAIRQRRDDVNKTVIEGEAPRNRPRRPPKHLVSRRGAAPTKVRATARRSVVFSSRGDPTATLDGTSLPSGVAPEVGDVRQWSGTIIRIFDTTATGSTSHRIKFRIVVFFDGQNVVRYSVFRDHESSRGFGGESRYELSLHQAQTLAPTADRPAEVHIRYDGQVTVHGKGTVVFDGILIARGDGHVTCTDPNIVSGTGKGAMLRNAATIGWW